MNRDLQLAIARAALQTFRESRVAVADLSKVIDTDDLAGIAGFVYLGDFYIEREPDDWLSFRLTVDRAIYRSADLDSLEVLLCAWVVENAFEELVDERQVSAELLGL